jgi:hypothetical protein
VVCVLFDVRIACVFLTKAKQSSYPIDGNCFLLSMLSGFRIHIHYWFPMEVSVL